MTKKIVFFDVDGTLTDHETGRIPQSTELAVKQLLDRGVIVVAATGRPLAMCEELAQLGIRNLITANGALVTIEDETIHKVVMSQQVVNEVNEYSIKHNHALSYYQRDLRMNGVRHDLVLKALKETLHIEKYPRTFIEGDVHLMCLFADEVIERQYQSTFPKLTFKRWHPYILNVLECDINKALAIQTVLDYFHLTAHDAVAFGDGDNDIEMLEVVSVGVAMENGSERLKRKATVITRAAKDDGIAIALRELRLVE
ncbi:Cof-type HAD-IIB family hydrolase [Alkalihalobacillus pseudalcaliphilus]|uniref:Cof-type HAD-IIB family hydrolase n=1 Tax=Alkalihalobacillus pseudalcaliphilus TaxID=79884 RepID=UPI00064DE369|nr:Cof-type HAD-IIB family hydrolase [Alkalihalobacillus pseudalcaliphilus]KMK77529.1 HAD family hydrolase [Alkalihalobacillus pseudalcaliphilus]